ncbi:hypothetical protein ABZ321_50200, partial [Dactylosporangium sp. NPDC006015]
TTEGRGATISFTVDGVHPHDVGQCDIDRVVIGGGVAAAGDVLLAPIRRALADRDGMAFLRRLRVEASTLGRDGGLYGAAALALGTLTVPA